MQTKPTLGVEVLSHFHDSATLEFSDVIIKESFAG